MVIKPIGVPSRTGAPHLSCHCLQHQIFEWPPSSVRSLHFCALEPRSSLFFYIVPGLLIVHAVQSPTRVNNWPEALELLALIILKNHRRVYDEEKSEEKQSHQAMVQGTARAVYEEKSKGVTPVSCLKVISLCAASKLMHWVNTRGLRSVSSTSAAEAREEVACHWQCVRSYQVITGTELCRGANAAQGLAARIQLFL